MRVDKDRLEQKLTEPRAEVGIGNLERAYLQDLASHPVAWGALGLGNAHHRQPPIPIDICMPPLPSISAVTHGRSTAPPSGIVTAEPFSPPAMWTAGGQAWTARLSIDSIIILYIYLSILSVDTFIRVGLHRDTSHFVERSQERFHGS